MLRTTNDSLALSVVVRRRGSERR